MEARAYRDLVLWKKAMDLAAASYGVADRLPSVERFGLAAQLRRAAVSVPANIAEGNGRTHRRAYLLHLSIARGSLKEIETYLALAERLGYLAPAECRAAVSLAADVGRLLTGLMRALST